MYVGYPVTAFTRTAEFGLPYGGIPYNELAYIHGVPTIGIHYLTLQGVRFAGTLFFDNELTVLLR